MSQPGLREGPRGDAGTLALGLGGGGGATARNLEYRHCQTIQDSKHVYLKCQYVRNVGSLGALIKSNRIRFFARQPNRS